MFEDKLLRNLVWRRGRGRDPGKKFYVFVCLQGLEMRYASSEKKKEKKKCFTQTHRQLDMQRRSDAGNMKVIRVCNLRGHVRASLHINTQRKECFCLFVILHHAL